MVKNKINIYLALCILLIIFFLTCSVRTKTKNMLTNVGNMLDQELTIEQLPLYEI